MLIDQRYAKCKPVCAYNCCNRLLHRFQATAVAAVVAELPRERENKVSTSCQRVSFSGFMPTRSATRCDGMFAGRISEITRGLSSTSKGVIADAGGRFERVAFPPVGGVDHVTDLRLVDAVDVLQEQADLTDRFAGRPQRHEPEAWPSSRSVR